jgi:hypothetical protein
LKAPASGALEEEETLPAFGDARRAHSSTSLLDIISHRSRKRTAQLERLAVRAQLGAARAGR